MRLSKSEKRVAELEEEVKSLRLRLRETERLCDRLEEMEADALAEVKRLQAEVEERITAHYTLANGWSRAEQEWEQEKRRLLKEIEQLKEE